MNYNEDPLRPVHEQQQTQLDEPSKIEIPAFDEPAMPEDLLPVKKKKKRCP